ncbi:tetratricopeptide repeat protein [Tamlana sp. 2_MG-2023]|uniref:tetratricopeptide repeat-containing sensor histidine kinase n=1 Tax=unclassified Tamlana TaxID=2614803 RepID=UPI0026E25BE6|nr:MULTISPECIES: tetratricopeptide repeat-containing sensor histidine kinase [unclassified Tamlana]MDO6761828.1 tetratricopeptide repeat protein [Tamlana sp. 2_MG-2023]MDO6792601.1 tetratricopeptide repeat protein [Tamlana sp. 1_MG-2023]
MQAQNIKDVPEDRTQKFNKNYKEDVTQAFSLLNNNKSDEAYKTAHKLLKKDLDTVSKVNINVLLSYYFNSRQLIDSSLFYSNRALKSSNLIQNDSLKSRLHSITYNLLAINYKRKGLLEESKKWHYKGVDVSQKYNDNSLYYMHLHGLANIYKELGDYDNALKTFEKCLNAKDETEIIYGSYINIGDIYAILEDYDASNTYYEKALKLSREDRNFYALAVIKTSLATNYYIQNHVEKALSLYHEVILLSEDKEYKQLALSTHLAIGSIYIDLEQYHDAQLVFSSGLHNAIELGYLNEQQEIYDNLKNIFIAKNDYKSALEFSTKSNHIKDSINQLQKDKEVNEIEVKYKTFQKEKEISLLQVENNNRKLEIENKNEALNNLKLRQEVENKENENKLLSFQNASEKKLAEIALLKKDQQIQQTILEKEKSEKKVMLYFFLILLIPIIGLLVLYYQKLQTQSELNKKQEEIKKKEISSLITDQELKLVKASIKGQNKERKRIAQELHDSIGGNLAAIKLKLNNATNSHEVPFLNTINKQLDDTYEQVRYLSHDLVPKQFNENNFCEVLKEYIHSIWGAKSTFSAYPTDKIDLLDKNLQIEIFKIIQELTTNTIKHAKATFIDLQINLLKNELSILFEDDGVGFSPEDHKTGIGYKNIKSRLKQFKGALNIDSRINRGTIINIEIPIIIPAINEV